MTIQLNWDQIQPQHKWTILKKQKRFAFWALFGSLGGVMFGEAAWLRRSIAANGRTELTSSRIRQCHLWHCNSHGRLSEGVWSSMA